MATATSKLQIIVDVLGDKAEKGLKGISGSLSQIAMITGTVVAAGYAAKQAWDFTKEGAELEKVAGQFRNVAENAGYAADVLLNEMRAATGGLVSDAELIASGLNIIELGLADSQQGVVDLATVVSTLGLDMQQVIMTFANDSIMRLDALGLSVETVTNRAAELKREGFTGDAFDQAVLEGLQKRMEVLGDVTETTAGQMQRMETQLSNMTDRAKQLAAVKLAPAIDGWSDFLDVRFRVTDAIAAGTITEQEWQSIIIQGQTVAEDYSLAIDLIKEREQMASIEAHGWAAAQMVVNETIAVGSPLADMYAQSAMDAAAANLANADATETASSATESYNDHLQAAAGAASTLSTNVFSVTQRLQDNLDFINAGGLALLALVDTAETAMDEGNYEGAANALDAAAQGAVDLDLELGNIDPAEAVERLMDLGLGPEEATAKVAEFEASLFAVTTKRWVVQVDFAVSGSGDLPPGVSVPGTGSGGGTGPSDDFGNIGGPGINSIDSGGSSIIIENINVQDGTDFLNVIKDLQTNSTRNSMSSAAGSAYIQG